MKLTVAMFCFALVVLGLLLGLPRPLPLLYFSGPVEGIHKRNKQEITLVLVESNKTEAEVCKNICSEEDVGINILRGGKFRWENYPLGIGEVGFLRNEKIYSQKEVSKKSRRVNNTVNETSKTIWSLFQCRDKDCKQYRTTYLNPLATLPRKGMPRNVWCCENFSTPEYDYKQVSVQ